MEIGHMNLYKRFISLTHFFGKDDEFKANITSPKITFTELNQDMVNFEDRNERMNYSIIELENEIKNFSRERNAFLEKQINDLRRLSKQALLEKSLPISIKPSAKKDISQIGKLLALKLRAFTVNELDIIKKAFGSSPTDVVAEFENLSLTVADISTLKPRRWLNDEVVNFYMGLLQKAEGKLIKNFFFNTFFFTALCGESFNSYNYNKVRRWTKRKKIDLFAMKRVFVPINLNNCHWTLAVIEIGKKEILYLDSFANEFPLAFKHLQKYLIDEFNDKKGDAAMSDENELDFKHISIKNLPRQLNSYDCGVFVCTAAEFISAEEPLNYSQKHMEQIRNRMVLEIMAQRSDIEEINQ